VSYLVSAAQHHDWAVEQWKRLAPPLHTCEAVLAEAGHLLARENKNADQIIEFLELGVLKVDFAVQEEATAVKYLIRRYHEVPMSVADACLVRMTETHPRCVLVTTDSDFRIYRRNGRQVIPVLMPDAD